MQRPMVEDEVIASQLEALLTLFYYVTRSVLSTTGIKRQDSQPTINGSGGANFAMERRGGSDGVN